MIDISITTETRKNSLNELVEHLGNLQESVLSELSTHDSPPTANELASLMYKKGFFSNADRNNVHPRLNELVHFGLVKVEGKRKCRISGKTCATYSTALKKVLP